MATPTSSTLSKAFQVLNLFREHPMLTAQVCAEQLDLPRSTAHRLLVSLRDVGVLEVTSGGRYRLGLALFELGSLAPLRRRLADRARLPLELLAQEVGFRVHLAVRQDVHVLYLETLHGPKTRHVPTRVGYRGPIHATGIGKLLLAHAPDRVFERVVSGRLDRFTANTIHTPEALQAEMEQIRREGVAYDDEECLMGLACVAVPVHGQEGEVLAAASVSASPAAMATRGAHFRSRLLQTAEIIEEGLGWEASLDWVLTQQVREADFAEPN